MSRLVAGGIRVVKKWRAARQRAAAQLVRKIAHVGAASECRLCSPACPSIVCAATPDGRTCNPGAMRSRGQTRAAPSSCQSCGSRPPRRSRKGPRSPSAHWLPLPSRRPRSQVSGRWPRVGPVAADRREEHELPPRVRLPGETFLPVSGARRLLAPERSVTISNSVPGACAIVG